jgi:hypothetical protein
MEAAVRNRFNELRCNLRGRITILTLAVAAGYAGGLLRDATRPSLVFADEPRVVRAQSIELVDNTGKVLASLGSPKKGYAALAFYNEQGRKEAELGVQGGSWPFLDLNETDGTRLMSLGLGEGRKPQLILSDKDFNGRVFLGVSQPDAPDPAWKYDAWVLRFRGDHGQPLATLGMKTGTAGGVLVRDQAGHEWRTPLKE